MKNENDDDRLRGAGDMSEIGQELHERLCAYVFGELAGDERAAFERELLCSPALQAERVRLDATIGLVKRAIPDEGLSLAVRRDVLASARRSRFRILRGRPLMVLAAAGVLLLGGALVLRWLAGGGSNGPFTYGIDDLKVANRSEERAAVPARSDDASALESLKGLGYIGSNERRANPAQAAAAPQAVAPEVARELDGVGYGDHADGAKASAPIVDQVSANAPAKEPPSAQAPLEQLRNLGYGGADRARSPTGAASPGAGRSGEGVPSAFTARRAGIAKGPATGSAGGEGFFLGHGAKKKDEDRGPGDSAFASTGNALVPPPSSAEPSGAFTLTAVKDVETLKAMGYSGRDDGDEKSEALDFASAALDGPEGKAQREPLTRVQVQELTTRLLNACQPQANESPRDMFFRYWGDAPFVAASEEHTSTFAVDVDTASYTLARSYLNAGQLPPREAVRTEEFVNYFKADQPPPSDGKPFAIGLELAPSLFATDTRSEMLRVTVRAKDVADFERQPLALTFVIDDSGSMQQNGRLELVKRSLGLLLRQLYAGDSVAVVKFSNGASVVTPPLAAARRGELETLIQAIPIEGGTNVEAGLRTGYELAVQNLQPHAVNRVILCSDGVGNIGETTSSGLLALVKDARAKGIYLNTVGVGMGNLNDAFLEQLADQGDGVCNYVDSDAEAKRVFVDGIASALQPVARDVKVQVEFDPAQVESWRLLGYENRALENQMFRDDRIDAGEVNAGHQVSALYELVRQPGRSGALATVRVRYKPPFAVDAGRFGEAARAENEKALELERTIASVEARPGFPGASNGYQRCVLVAQFAEVLRSSVHARGDSLATLVQESRRLEGVLRDPDFTEFVALLAQANPLLDARAKEAPPKVQTLLDELAQAHYDLARRGRMRQLEADAADKDSLEARLEKARGESGERDAEARRQQEEQALRERIQKLEEEVRAELGGALGGDGGASPFVYDIK